MHKEHHHAAEPIAASIPNEPVTPSAPVIVARAPNPYLIPISIVIGSCILGLFIMIGLSQMGKSGDTSAQAAGAVAVDVKKIDISDAPFIGDPNAPVTLVYWSDYQCPFCKAFEVGGIPQINTKIPSAMPEIIQKYVDTGEVKVVFKEFPFLGEDSITAAEYAYAIWELYPQQFYPWRVAMFKAQDEEGDQGFGDAPSIDSLIKKQFPKIDLSRVKQQITQRKDDYAKAMSADRAEAQKNGINGTPGFITGTQLIGGDAPFSTFSAAIDPQLK